jgi:hypothetical protein
VLRGLKTSFHSKQTKILPVYLIRVFGEIQLMENFITVKKKGI